MVKGRNLEWARDLLERYRAALVDLDDAREYDLSHPDNLEHYESSLQEALRLNPGAWRIVEDVVPDVSEYDHDLRSPGQVDSQILDVTRAVGWLHLQLEFDENWPSEPVAKLDTSELHPWVWEPARELWGIERYAEALHAAALTVNAHLQKKLGRKDDMEFTPLARAAWSTKDPTPGNPRLRFDLSNEWSEDAVEDFHTGAATLGEAVFRLWRNIRSHRLIRVDEQRATEALGALSTFARMVDAADVVQALEAGTPADGPK
jgi:hypothetical protein